MVREDNRIKTHLLEAYGLCSKNIRYTITGDNRNKKFNSNVSNNGLLPFMLLHFRRLFRCNNISRFV